MHMKMDKSFYEELYENDVFVKALGRMVLSSAKFESCLRAYTLLIPTFRFFIQPMSSKLFVSKERNSRWYLLGFRKNSSQAALNSANVS